MNTRTITIVLTLIAVLAVGVFVWASWMPAAPADTGTATTTPDTTAAADDMIRITSPQPNTAVTSTLHITGEARGTWYFEASFPVRLEDANGTVLAQAPAQAQGDWMTTDFVPFAVDLVFQTPTTQTGTLILEKDNPSGMPENAAERRIPVRFDASSSAATQGIKLYYYNANNDKDAQGNVLCSANGLVAVNRSIPKTTTPLADSIKLLLQGNITASEKAQGITTEFPLAGVSFTSAAITNGAATITLADPQSKTSGGACRASVLKEQVQATAKQFSTVTSVTILPATLFQP